MRLKNRLFQHPVLSPYSDDYIDEAFEMNIDQELQDDGLLNLHFSLKLTEPTLLKWIRYQEASFGILVECPKTSFREFYRFQDFEFDISLKIEQLIEKVSIQAYILLDKNQENFYSPSFNPLYQGSHFKLNSNSIIGLSLEHVIEIEPEEEALKSVASIFKVIKQANLDEDAIDINYQGDFIHVYLSTIRYQEYKRVERLTRNSPHLLHAILVVPVLTNVLKDIEKYALEEVDFKWYRSLIDTMTEKGIDYQKMLEKNDLGLILSNKLMDFPTLKSMETLESIFKVKEDIDEEI